ncbi:phage antirepressor KilAC domain-containing protein [Streptomyces celluloflavus]|uniref:phage antirepressor KilAC domain-containing protein n=1 Tax=Streptomyces celluloflavus TaxID=58344 RepID=UPI00369C7EA5
MSMMPDAADGGRLPLSGGSPFDAIRRVDERGEYWSGRELLPLLGYESWRRFENAVQRATAAACNSEARPEDHFAGAVKVILGGRWGQQTVDDYRLTRYGCYLVAMNGDPRKPEIAAAQTYFAVKTREAETAAVSAPAEPQWEIPADYASALELAAQQTRALEAQTAKVAELEPKAQYVDEFVMPEDVYQLSEVAADIPTNDKALRCFLIERGWVFRKHIGRRWSASKQRMTEEYEWRPTAYSKQRGYFRLLPQHGAPRYHNGQVRQTLYATVPGRQTITRLWRARHDGGQLDFGGAA